MNKNKNKQTKQNKTKQIKQLTCCSHAVRSVVILITLAHTSCLFLKIKNSMSVMNFEEKKQEGKK